MKGKSDGGETCAKCFELKMRIPIDYAFVVKMLTPAAEAMATGKTPLVESPKRSE
jgi:hypothetical protein